MNTYKVVQDSKREEFRKYLEKNGVMEVLTRCLVSLYEEPEKPADALQYVRNTLGAASPDKVELESLRVVVAEMREKMMIMEEENKDLRTKVASLRLDEEGATEEGDMTTDGGDPSPAPPADKDATKDKPEKK